MPTERKRMKVYIDSFSGNVSRLTAKEKKYPKKVLEALSKDPMVSTFDMGTHDLWKTIKYLESEGLIESIPMTYPWHKFVVTEKGKKEINND
jgi:hypothetical protein